MAMNTHTQTRPAAVLRARLTGTTFNEWAAMARLGGMHRDALPVTLRARPDNTHDPLAVEVLDELGYRIGWLPAQDRTPRRTEIAEAIHALGEIDGTAEVVVSAAHPDRPGIDVIFCDPRIDAETDPLLAQLELADPDAEPWIPETDPLLMQLARAADNPAWEWLPALPADSDADGWGEPDPADELWEIIEVNGPNWTCKRAAEMSDADRATARRNAAVRNPLGARRPARRRMLR